MRTLGLWLSVLSLSICGTGCAIGGSTGFNQTSNSGSNSGSSPQQTTPAPSASLNQQTLSFGSVTVNATATQSVAISNTGNASLTVSQAGLWHGLLHVWRELLLGASGRFQPGDGLLLTCGNRRVVGQDFVYHQRSE